MRSTWRPLRLSIVAENVQAPLRGWMALIKAQDAINIPPASRVRGENTSDFHEAAAPWRRSGGMFAIHPVDEERHKGAEAIVPGSQKEFPAKPIAVRQGPSTLRQVAAVKACGDSLLAQSPRSTPPAARW